MPRSRRLIPVDSAMHITCRGNNKQNVFQNSVDKYCYYGLMRDLKDENGIKVFHYCLMDNHAHIIIWLDEHARLSRFMQQLNLAYFKYFEKSYAYCGHLFQSRFGGAIIDSERYLLQCGKYISLNPVRAGIVNRPEDYRFSSYNHYAHGKFDALVTDDPLYVGLSDSVEKRRQQFIKYVIDDKVVNSQSLRNQFIGNEEYVKRLQTLFSINPASKRGRPRKIGDRSEFPGNSDLSPIFQK